MSGEYLFRLQRWPAGKDDSSCIVADDSPKGRIKVDRIPEEKQSSINRIGTKT